MASESSGIFGEAVHSCNNGYEFPSEDLSRTCLLGQSTIRWFNGSQLQCSAIPTYYFSPDGPHNTTITSQSNTIFCELVYCCNNCDSYMIASGDIPRTCIAGDLEAG
eukprot:755092_1